MTDSRVGAVAREERAAALDVWLAELYAGIGGPADGVALVATGGLGRRECAPYGDIDLMLLHRGHPGAGEFAHKLWYPIWDAKVGLDHSVRTLPEALSVAIEDVRVALSLLDVRFIAGDPALAESLRRSGADQWRRTAGRALVKLREAGATRTKAHGDLAFLLEGDLKEAAGGLRDVQALRAIATLGVADVHRPAVRAAHARLLDVRDALHASVGRRVDRLIAQERHQVAELLGLADGDALLRRVSTDARAISYALGDAWRAVDRWRAPVKSARTPVARDVVAQDGEIVLARTVITAQPDAGLALRVMAASASSGIPIARATLEFLDRFAPAMPTPWPEDIRRSFIALLGAGEGMAGPWDASDRYGLIGRILPEWNRLRGLPQHHPIHAYTVDWHCVRTVIEAHAFTREVSRPDLLLVGALLHDVGKGLPGDHSDAGAPLAARVAVDMGFPPADVAMIERLVRMHLLLPDVATRRDLSDPVTVADVAAAVGDVATLELLHGLCRADAIATGTDSAASAWRLRLVADLVDRVRALVTGSPDAAPAPEIPPALLTASVPAVLADDETVTVVAADRRGLLASVAGVLALHRLDVIGADTLTVGERAIVRVSVIAKYGAAPDRTRLLVDLRLAAAGQLPADRLARIAVSRSADRKATVTDPTVTWHADATDAMVLELRASDSSGLLYRVTSALEAAGADVRAARVATLGGDVVDAFYLAGDWSDPERRDRTGAAVLAAAGSDAGYRRVTLVKAHP
jgi:[protein-PII] uridylyltransferase